MYSTGLDLQQKLDKIMDYDKCSPDSAKLVGMKSYCKQLFKDQPFYFWSKQDLENTCDDIDIEMQMSQQKDECAVMNDHIYGKYHEKQKLALKQIEVLSRKLIEKKNEKGERLKMFV